MKPRHKEYLQGFLYTLMRDYVPVEELSRLVLDAEEHPPPYEFTNTSLAEVAGEFASRLLTDSEANRVNRENFEATLLASQEACARLARGDLPEEEVAVEEAGCRVFWVRKSDLPAVLAGGARRLR